jgi:hypothetical protein
MNMWGIVDAKNGPHALRHQPRLVLMDVRLPRITGMLPSVADNAVARTGKIGPNEARAR